jgi:hypothetical protein
MSTDKPGASGWHTIKVDGDVLQALRDAAQPFIDHEPNDVLRRQFLTGDGASVAPPPSERKPGALAEAIRKGTLKAGERLICEQPRRKRTFRAEVTAEGWIAVIDPDMGEFAKPSPALQACTGGAINGWGNWIVERTRQRLQDYRN